MNELTISETAPTSVELSAMSTEQLRERLLQSLTMTARHLQYLSMIWGELESLAWAAGRMPITSSVSASCRAG